MRRMGCVPAKFRVLQRPVDLPEEDFAGDRAIYEENVCRCRAAAGACRRAGDLCGIRCGCRGADQSDSGDRLTQQLSRGAVARYAAFLEKKKPDTLRGLAYGHQPLDKQFDGGVRQIELDIFADSKGGRYAHPAGPALEAAVGVPVDGPDANADTMLQPGFEMSTIM